MNYNEVEQKDNMKITVDTEATPVTKPKHQPLVTKAPTKQKKNLLKRLTQGLLGPGGFEKIGSFVSDDIVKPALKKMFVDAVNSSAHMAVYGENAPTPVTSRSVRASEQRITSRTNYRDAYNHTPNTNAVAKPRSSYYLEDYIITDGRETAVEILSTMREAADMYDTVAVADYYDMIGVPSVHTDHNFGWTIDTIVLATILPSGSGYLIKFPPVQAINR